MAYVSGLKSGYHLRKIRETRWRVLKGFGAACHGSNIATDKSPLSCCSEVVCSTRQSRHFTQVDLDCQGRQGGRCCIVCAIRFVFRCCSRSSDSLHFRVFPFHVPHRSPRTERRAPLLCQRPASKRGIPSPSCWSALPAWRRFDERGWEWVGSALSDGRERFWGTHRMQQPLAAWPQGRLRVLRPRHPRRT